MTFDEWKQKPDGQMACEYVLDCSGDGRMDAMRLAYTAGEIAAIDRQIKRLIAEHPTSGEPLPTP